MVFLRESSPGQPLRLPSLKELHWGKRTSEDSVYSELARLEQTSPSGHKECFACKLPIFDLPEAFALGKRWHEECFKCSACGKLLNPNRFKEKHGKAYCEFDYNSLFLPKCFTCSKTILQSPINVLNRTYHPDCFTCTKCSMPICHHGFRERKGNPYCEEDYHRLFSPKCYACGEPIKDPMDMTLALGVQFHREHFVCFECTRPLPANNYVRKDGQVYCEEDFHALFSPRCAQCDEPIRHEGLKALGKLWHKNCCLRCGACNKVLREDNYIQVADKAYCKADWKKLFAPRCHTCHHPVSEALTGESVIALGREYHPECFMCKDCNEGLDERSYYEFKGEPYCYEHYHNKTCPDCLKAREEKEKMAKKVVKRPVTSFSTQSRRSISPLYSFIRPKSTDF